MTELSPAAQAVLDAMEQDGKIIYGMPLLRPLIAAALRAAADQVVPESTVYKPTSDGTMRREGDLWIIRREIYAIAAELEKQ